MGITSLIIGALYFALPIFFANMAPVFVRGIKFLEKPIDAGGRLKGKPLFGKNKTWRGLAAGIAAGMLIFWIQTLLYEKGIGVSISIIDYSSWCPVFGAVMGLGAILGDMIESFFKRRISIKPGNPWIPFDQVDFMLGALILVSMILVPPWEVWAILLFLTPLLHIATNHTAYYLKIRKKKW